MSYEDVSRPPAVKDKTSKLDDKQAFVECAEWYSLLQNRLLHGKPAEPKSASIDASRASFAKPLAKPDSTTDEA